VAKEVIFTGESGVEIKICAVASHCGIAVNVTKDAGTLPTMLLAIRIGKLRTIKRRYFRDSKKTQPLESRIQCLNPEGELSKPANLTSNNFHVSSWNRG